MVNQVHADASNFGTGISKKEAYDQVIEQTKSLIDGQRNWCLLARSNLANVASLLWHALKSLPLPSNTVNWAGFYVLDPKKDKQLILGPFHGKVACQTIAFTRGVCGKAASTGQTQVVDNVHSFPGHIACDDATNSEIVVPIILDGKVLGLIDIDAELVNGFDQEDKEALETLANVLAEGCDW